MATVGKRRALSAPVYFLVTWWPFSKEQMKVNRSMKRLIRASTLSLLFVCTGFTLVPGLRAQEPAAQPTTRPSGSGWLWVEQFSGSATNGAGQVMSLNSTTGYNFTSHFGVVAGLPVYFFTIQARH